MKLQSMQDQLNEISKKHDVVIPAKKLPDVMDNVCSKPGYNLRFQKKLEEILEKINSNPVFMITSLTIEKELKKFSMFNEFNERKYIEGKTLELAEKIDEYIHAYKNPNPRKENIIIGYTQKQELKKKVEAIRSRRILKSQEKIKAELESICQSFNYATPDLVRRELKWHGLYDNLMDDKFTKGETADSANDIINFLRDPNNYWKNADTTIYHKPDSVKKEVAKWQEKKEEIALEHQKNRWEKALNNVHKDVYEKQYSSESSAKYKQPKKGLVNGFVSIVKKSYESAFNYASKIAPVFRGLF